ncbi:L,D-peptidoglycan transpeptidase YkuD, ErfK/YbiS/YcfS/YnhG family [Streptomyces sp. 2231.1]|uniref:L,D-transpeptidase family protein n=1 Tax=Streptomyces sp. 2231.1 TaxID=1855347 RepID=UPI000899E984|nr:L,D-transpeptidase family protein [Streptomyces sp. 2231.1]SEC32262.1 L,D-peptidoglycan transpeptidase YkuD, ErfK/YbiS/YcfS/YnhG family [Streptomyces sp. 2231.1]
MIQRRTAVALLASPLLLTGCGGGAEATERRTPTGRPAPTATPVPEITAEQAPQGIPGLGPERSAAIPDRCEQAVVVTGRGRNSPLCTVVLHQRSATGWRPGPRWPGHNALRGWSAHHLSGDLRSPLGVYTLSDAGGLLADPGSRLPYHHSGGFHSPGTGFEGEPLDGSFDYVVAIDYNRRRGTSPLDWTRPLGPARGGGVWLHVDHGGPTHGCVSVAKAHMKELLRTLDPHRHPVVVMGYADWLAG